MGFLSSLTGGDAAKAAKKAASQQIAGIDQASQYLQNYYEPIQGYQSDAMSQLAGLYGVGGQDPSAMYNAIMQDPMYQQMLQQRLYEILLQYHADYY